MLAIGPSRSIHLLRTPEYILSCLVANTGLAVYWLVFFSIVVHGLSIPALNAIYKVTGVTPVVDPSGPAEVRPLSANIALPKNSFVHGRRRSIIMYNRFSRSRYPEQIGWELPVIRDDAERTKRVSWEA